MTQEQLTIVRQYASAFLNVYGAHVHPSEYEKMHQVAQFLSHSVEAKRFLKIPIISNAYKKEQLQRLCAITTLPASIMTLIEVLVSHDRAEFLGAILEYLYLDYAKKNNIEFFTITAAQPLSDEQCEKVEHFLAQKTGKKIQTSVAVDLSLIAGLRMTSSSSVWEYSIRKQLHTMRVVRKELYGH